MGFSNCSMFCCTLFYVPSSFAIILMGKTELDVLLSLSSWCLVIIVWLFLAVPWVSLQFVIVFFPDHTHLLFLLHNDHSKKGGKIRNRYNQVPHLTQDTTWESDKNTIKHYKREPRGQPSPSR